MVSLLWMIPNNRDLYIEHINLFFYAIVVKATIFEFIPQLDGPSDDLYVKFNQLWYFYYAQRPIKYCSHTKDDVIDTIQSDHHHTNEFHFISIVVSQKKKTKINLHKKPRPHEVYKISDYEITKAIHFLFRLCFFFSYNVYIRYGF